MVYAQTVLENETHKPLWDFEIQTDHLISARWADFIMIKKKRTCQIVDFAVRTDHWVKLKESEKKDKYLDPDRGMKKLWNMKVIVIPVVIRALSAVRIGKKTRRLGNKWTSGDHPNYSIAEIGQNNEKSRGDLRRLGVTQTPVKDHQLTLMWKTLKE